MIAAGEVRAFRLPLATPLVTAAGRIARREGCVLALRDESGAWGFGEASPLPGHPAFAAEDATRSAQVLQTLLPRIERRNAAEIAKSIADLVPADAPAARFALETATADLASRRAGLSLGAWLAGGPVPERVPVNALLADGDVRALEDAALRARDAGYRAVKLKVATASPAEDLVRVERLRDCLGPDVAIRVDANAGWDEDTAARQLESFESFAIEYVEDPVPVESARGVAALARLREGSPVPIAADESLADAARATEIVEQGAADVLILKPAPLGGAGSALALAARAHARGIESVVTSTIDGAVGLTASLHLAAAVASVDGEETASRACGLGTASWLAEDIGAPPPVDAGFMALPDAPGLGVEPTGAGAFG